MTLVAFHGNPQLKADAIARMRDHVERDGIIQGSWVALNAAAPGGYRGCFHGCLTTDLLLERGVTFQEVACMPWFNTWYDLARDLFGFPLDLSRVLDHFFEDAPSQALAGEFAVKVLEAIPVGADLEVIEWDDIRYQHDEPRGRAGWLDSVTIVYATLRALGGVVTIHPSI